MRRPTKLKQLVERDELAIVYERYEGRSAKTPGERPEFYGTLDYIRDGWYEAVITCVRNR